MNKNSITAKKAYISPVSPIRQLDMEGMIATSIQSTTLTDMDVNEIYDEDF